MARSIHAQYTAAEKFERRANRRQTPVKRREGTRYLAIAAAIREA